MATDSHDILEPTGHRRKRIELKEDDYKEKPLPEVWNALGIDVDKLDKDDVVGLTSGVKIPKVYLDLVLRFREYNDKEPDTSVTFKWELVSVALLESNLIKAIELKTDQTPVVLPSGWLFSRIADILGTDYEIPNPRLSARAAKPAIIWPMGGIQKRSERSKVFDCARTILNEHGIAAATAWNQVDPKTKVLMVHKLREALRLPVKFSDDFFYEWVLIKCRRR